MICEIKEGKTMGRNIKRVLYPREKPRDIIQMAIHLGRGIAVSKHG